MYKNIIKLAAIAAKDTPSAIMKKLRKHDPGFVQDCDLELESYLSRKSSLSFGDFAVLLEDCYARYAIEQTFINRFTDDLDQRHVMYEEIKLSVPELRRCNLRPYVVIWNQLEETLCRNAEYVMDFIEIELSNGGYPQVRELELDKGESDIGALINTDKGIEGLYLQLADLRPAGQDEEIYAATLAASYTIWLQAVTGWTKPMTILRECFPDTHFTSLVTGKRVIKKRRESEKMGKKCNPKSGKGNKK